MKTMKSFFTAFFLIGMMVAMLQSGVQAQEIQKQGTQSQEIQNQEQQNPGIHKNQHHLSSKLNLSEAQKEEMKTIHQEMSKKREALREEEKARMKAILSPEQFARLEEIRATHRKEQVNFGRGERKAMKAEVDRYLIDHVLPKVLSARQEFEGKLSQIEREEISELRKDLQTLNQSQDIAREEKKTRRKVLMEKAQIIVKNHQEELKPLQESFKPQVEIWQAEIRMIVEKYNQEKGNQEKGRPNGGSEKIEPQHKGGPQPLRMTRGAHFILLDPAMTPAQVIGKRTRP